MAYNFTTPLMPRSKASGGVDGAGWLITFGS
jgi:hypothetical protein